MSESKHPDDLSPPEGGTSAEEPGAAEGQPEPEPVAEPAPAAEPQPEPESVPEPEPEPAPSPSAAVSPAPRRLVRSSEDRVIAGVCGGIGEYLGVDAVLIRIAALVLIFAGGAGLILYVIGWIAMPEAPAGAVATGHAAPARDARDERTTGAVVVGALFVLVGAFFLLDEVFPDFLSWEWMWPIALIAVGAVVILRARR